MSRSTMSFHRWWLVQYSSLFVLLLVIGIQFINAQSNIKTSFSCQGRPSGYYADVESGCQIYHMCDGLGRQFSYSCPNTTLFQQRMLICDHWYMVNCSKSEDDYTANLLIGQREKPFVEDSEDHPYYRTPRPDLLAHPSASEYNIIYRIGRAQVGSNQNLVGADSNEDGEKNEGPAYFLPSHWSTEYKKSSKPLRNSQKVDLTQQSQVELKTTGFANEAFNEIKSNNAFKRVDSDVSKTIPVNFKSNFAATTPVYPQFVEPEVPLASGELTNVGTGNIHTVVLPPSLQTNQNIRSRTSNRQNIRTSNIQNARPIIAQNFRQVDAPSPIVNFKSTFKATTPVYPVTLDDETIAKNNFDFGDLTVGNGQQQENSSSVVVNFNSDFKATTPVYPTALDEETKLKNEYDFGQLLPLTRNDRNKPIVNFQSAFKATTPVYPNFVDPALVRKHNDDFSGETPKLEQEEAPVPVNFKSNFKATTPVYPKEVDPSVHLAGGGTFTGVAEGIAETIVPPRLVNNPSQPSITFESPRYQIGVLPGSENQASQQLPQSEALLIRKPPNTESQWQELRTMFLIPDYDFPLDTITRPAYESKGPNSFQANQNTHIIEDS